MLVCQISTGWKGLLCSVVNLMEYFCTRGSNMKYRVHRLEITMENDQSKLEHFKPIPIVKTKNRVV